MLTDIHPKTQQQKEQKETHYARVVAHQSSCPQGSQNAASESSGLNAYDAPSIFAR
jgi:hypothetical protein